MTGRPPWNAGRGGRHFRIGEPRAPSTVRSRLPIPTERQTRAERLPETTTEASTPENGQITGAGTPPQDEIEIERPRSETEQLRDALSLVGTNRYDVISSQLATHLETLSVQLQAQQRNADTLRETFEVAIVNIEARINQMAQRLRDRLRQNDKDVADIRKIQKELESGFQTQTDKLDAVLRGVDNVLLTTDRSLGEVGGIGQNFFMWLWKELVISPCLFFANRSPNQIGFLYTKAF
jgi:hypothetical protein